MYISINLGIKASHRTHAPSTTGYLCTARYDATSLPISASKVCNVTMRDHDALANAYPVPRRWCEVINVPHGSLAAMARPTASTATDALMPLATHHCTMGKLDHRACAYSATYAYGDAAAAAAADTAPPSSAYTMTCT